MFTFFVVWKDNTQVKCNNVINVISNAINAINESVIKQNKFNKQFTPQQVMILVTSLSR